jgi:NAD(P)-dependent dehydrogenase (short-subunit alcohol dehydrogenase family)
MSTVARTARTAAHEKRRKRMTTADTATLLAGKNAIIYGAGGSIGSSVAQTFAEQGATVFLTGRNQENLDIVAKEIAAAGGTAEVAVLDALSEKAVDAHAKAVVAQAGSIDVSFNLITRGDVQGTPLIDMKTADLTRPITNGVKSTFITARAAARQMTKQGSGVILALDSGSAHGSPMMGGTGPADAAIDTLIRNLAAEVGPQGVRVLGMWVAGIPETLSPAKLAAVNPALAGMDDAAVQGLVGALDEMRMLRRSPRLVEVAETAAFLASDRAVGITGTFVNVTGGMFPT